MLLPVYLRREPTTCPETLRMWPDAPRRKVDVVIYADPEARQRRGVYPWWQSGRPTRNARRVVFNCWTWRAVWLPDLPRPFSRKESA